MIKQWRKKNYFEDGWITSNVICFESVYCACKAISIHQENKKTVAATFSLEFAKGSSKLDKCMK